MQGIGTAIGHHGEIIQGVFERDKRSLVRGLVSLPCQALTSTATFSSVDGDEILVSPSWKAKSRDAVKNLLNGRKLPSMGGVLTVESNIPAGCGLGSSTADVVASIRAAANYHRIPLRPLDLARIAVEAEQACDSTMFDDEVVLFAQREGMVIEGLQGRLPAIDLVSVNVAPHKPVDTLAFPPARYSTSEIEQFRSLRGLLRTAIRSGNASLLGRVATVSATINQRHLPQDYFGEIKLIAEKNNALGVQVAHSGTVIGVMFDAAAPATSKAIANAMDDLTSVRFAPRLYHHGMDGICPSVRYSTTSARLSSQGSSSCDQISLLAASS